jgi:beta-lactamase superfamily II metal-dependent hydrolase
MADFYEIDFLDVESSKSGDAIPLRYEKNGVVRIHIVDGGFSDTGDKVVKHVKAFFGNPKRIDSVVVTHPDQDHACGVKKILEQFERVNEIWMLRPWIYAAELLFRFPRFGSAEGLSKRLREIYPYIADVEDVAFEKKIPIYEPFQGAKIGDFTVLAPSRKRYLDLVVESEKTPPVTEARQNLAGRAAMAFDAAKTFLKALWGVESFSDNETSAENEMSVIQYANLCGQKILLTADAGRSGLKEAADFAPYVGLSLPGIDRFQVPHHGGRRNVSTELLDRWLGPRHRERPAPNSEKFTAVISAAKKDDDHPRRAVVRAMIHRGAKVVGTKDGKDLTASYNAPSREGWEAAVPMEYPEDQED